MNDKPRPMTMDDYAEIGMVPPHDFSGCYRPGSVFSAAQQRHERGQRQAVIIEGARA